jgi:hypothetical protein
MHSTSCTMLSIFTPISANEPKLRFSKKLSSCLRKISIKSLHYWRKKKKHADSKSKKKTNVLEKSCKA